MNFYNAKLRKQVNIIKRIIDILKWGFVFILQENTQLKLNYNILNFYDSKGFKFQLVIKIKSF